MIQVSAVPPEQVELVWPHVLPMIEKGLKHGAGDSTTAGDLKKSILSEAMTLWAVHDEQEIVAAVILELVQHPAKRSVFVVLVAGREFHSWVHEIQRLLRELKQKAGADTIECMARKGMAKWLTQTGWRHKATLMEL